MLTLCRIAQFNANQQNKIVSGDGAWSALRFASDRHG